jgi:hypothetical protein
MATCGLWSTKRGIVAAVADDYGTANGPAQIAAHTAEAYSALIENIEVHHGLDCRFVVTDETLATERTSFQFVARRGTHILVVSAILVERLRVLTGCARSPPKKQALLLARLPLCRPLDHKLEPWRLQLDLF